MTRRFFHFFLAAGLLLAGCARNFADQLLSSDEGVRQAALRKLASESPADRREVVPFLVDRLADENGNVRRRALQALSSLGTDAVNPLVRTLRNKDRRARASAAQALGFLGADAKSAVGPLVEAEQDADGDVRMWAAVSLNRVKETMSPTEMQFFRLLYGKKEVVAPKETLKTAQALTGEDPRALLLGLRRAGIKSRTQAVLSLVEKGPLVVPTLLDALTDPDESTREGAAEALRLLTRDQVDTDQALVSFLRESDAPSREAYDRTFKGMNLSSPAAAPALAGLVSNESLCVRLEAIRSLGALGPDAKAAAPVLKAAADDPHPVVRQAALRALRRVLKSLPSEAQEALARRLSASWSEMTARLGRGEIEAALGYFAPSQRDGYRAAFLSLGAALPAVARSLDCPLTFRDAFGEGVVALEGGTLIEGVQQTLQVQFVKDDKGEWRIRGF